MGFDVRLIILSYCRLYLVYCVYPSVLRLFVGVGDLVRPSSVSWAWGGGGLTHPRRSLGTW